MKFLKIICLLLFLPVLIQGKEKTVIISEVAWMGTAASPYDEWIELKNTSEEIVNLEGWKLKSEEGTPEIKLKGIISPQEFLILERTDEDTLPEIKADITYTGGLKNTGERLVLLNENGETVDEINAEEGWPAGVNETKETMERKEDLSWQESEKPGGSPGRKNSPKVELLPPEENLIVSDKNYVKKADKRFFSTFTAGLITSLNLTSFIFLIKDSLKNES